MKLRASIAIEMDITNELIIEFENMNEDNPTLSEHSSDKKILEYFQTHNEEVMTWAKETAIDWLAEACDEVTLRGNYDLINVQEVI